MFLTYKHLGDDSDVTRIQLTENAKILQRYGRGFYINIIMSFHVLIIQCFCLLDHSLKIIIKYKLHAMFFGRKMVPERTNSEQLKVHILC